MKIKKFNEQLDTPEQGPEPVDRSKIDPYGEENWNDNPNKYSDEPGVCVHCGSEQLDWRDQNMYGGDTMIYEYTCLDCDQDGQEVYSIEFVRNERR